MALSGLDVFKLLPKTNCGECKFPTCLAFAMKLAAGQASLDDCPDVSDEAREKLTEASAPPIRGINVGTGDKEFKIGEELVMFRHEKTFFNPTGMGVMISDSAADEEIEARLKEASEASWERVGQTIEAKIIAVKCDSGDSAKFKSLLEKVKGSTDLAIMPMTEDPGIMKEAVEVLADRNPLLYCATGENTEAMGNLAKEKGLPLVARGDGLDSLAELSEKLTGMEVKDLILDPGTRNLKDTMNALIAIRRGALDAKFKPFGFPTIAFPCEETDDPFMEGAHASVYIAKYADIVMLSSLESWRLYPLMVEIQNVYTDPQKPMQVDPKFYPIGEPGEESPILITTNFSLTYFIVSGEIEGSKVDSWLGVVNSEGQSVLTGWASGKFVADTIGTFIKKSGIEDKVKTRKLVIPGYVAQISGELEEELPGWEIVVGTREAADIPAFLQDFSPV